MEDNQNITDNIENNENIPDNIENTSNASSDNGEELESSSLSHFRTNGRGMLNSGARGLDNFTRRANNFNRRLGNFSNKVGNKANETGKNKELADKIKNGSDNLNKKVGGLNSFNNKVQSANNVKNLLQDPGQATNVAKNMALDAAGDAIKTGAKKVVSNVILKNPYVLAIIGIFLFFIIIVVAIAGVDEGDFLESDSYVGYTSGNTQMWWPIGGTETSSLNGAIFATGDPSCTNITSKYGPRWGRIHSGYDIACGKNTDYIIAVLDGVVTATNDGCPTNFGTSCSTCRCGGGYGNKVEIDHGNGIKIIYAHMEPNSISVKKGDQVKQGQVLGRMGSTGSSTGYHLHFEIKVNETAVNPVDYVDPNNARPVDKVIENSSNSSDLVKFLQSWEGTGKINGNNYVVYDDGAGNLTVGHGVALKYQAEKFKQRGIDVSKLRVGSEISISIVDSIEAEAMEGFKQAVINLMNKNNITLNQCQYDALTSRAYNTGIGGLSGFPAMYRKYGDSEALYSNYLSTPVTASGKYLPGLKNRRIAEWNLFHNCMYQNNR